MLSARPSCGHCPPPQQPPQQPEEQPEEQQQQDEGLQGGGPQGPPPTLLRRSAHARPPSVGGGCGGAEATRLAEGYAAAAAPGAPQPFSQATAAAWERDADGSCAPPAPPLAQGAAGEAGGARGPQPTLTRITPMVAVPVEGRVALRVVGTGLRQPGVELRARVQGQYYPVRWAHEAAAPQSGPEPACVRPPLGPEQQQQQGGEDAAVLTISNLCPQRGRGLLTLECVAGGTLACSQPLLLLASDALDKRIEAELLHAIASDESERSSAQVGGVRVCVQRRGWELMWAPCCLGPPPFFHGRAPVHSLPALARARPLPPCAH